MTPAEFNSLYELETVIRSYDTDLDKLLHFWTTQYVEVQLTLRNPVNHPDFETPVDVFQIAGGGTVIPNYEGYSPNARVIQAGIKAMMNEIETIQNEAKTVRNYALRKTLEL